MNTLVRSVINIAKTYTMNSIEASKSGIIKHCWNPGITGSILNSANPILSSAVQGLQQIRTGTSIFRLHRLSPHRKVRKSKNPLDGKPFMKGVVIKTIIKHPKKPNSANRKCVVLKMSNGKEMTAYVPGIGHNLQEHNTVLVRCGRLRDTPGIKLKCVRGVYDLPHEIKRFDA